MADEPKRIAETLRTGQRKRNEAVQNYAVYYLKMDAADGKATIRDMSPERALFDIAAQRDAYADAAVEHFALGLQASQQQTEALRQEVDRLRRLVLAMGATTALIALAAVLVPLLR